jgi:hypothetical protein
MFHPLEMPLPPELDGPPDAHSLLFRRCVNAYFVQILIVQFDEPLDAFERYCNNITATVQGESDDERTRLQGGIRRTNF